MTAVIGQQDTRLRMGASGVMIAVMLFAITLSPTVRSGDKLDHAGTLDAWMVAYNQHDIEGMLKHAHPDIEWLFVKEDTVLVETRGTEALASGLKTYFSSLPSARGTVHNLHVHDRFASVTEQAHWIKDGEERSQCSLAVYEMEGRLIRRVWYYPSTGCQHLED